MQGELRVIRKLAAPVMHLSSMPFAGSRIKEFYRHPELLPHVAIQQSEHGEREFVHHSATC